MEMARCGSQNTSIGSAWVECIAASHPPLASVPLGANTSLSSSSSENAESALECVVPVLSVADTTDSGDVLNCSISAIFAMAHDVRNDMLSLMLGVSELTDDREATAELAADRGASCTGSSSSSSSVARLGNAAALPASDSDASPKMAASGDGPSTAMQTPGSTDPDWLDGSDASPPDNPKSTSDPGAAPLTSEASRGKVTEARRDRSKGADPVDDVIPSVLSRAEDDSRGRRGWSSVSATGSFEKSSLMRRAVSAAISDRSASGRSIAMRLDGAWWLSENVAIRLGRRGDSAIRLDTSSFLILRLEYFFSFGSLAALAAVSAAGGAAVTPLLARLRTVLLLSFLSASLLAGGSAMGFPRLAASSLFFRSCRRRMVEFQWFLTELSVRPGRSLAISAHLFPRVE
eukprot:m.99220 g.99220  ORF g.99220 m.99220 type:complete len:404 (+) comp20605_c0_seq1:217-1428(+)